MKLLKLKFPVCILLALLGPTDPGIQAVQRPDGQDKSVNIGLLISDSKSLSAKQGAEMAILKANENGGYNGKPFRLIVRSMEGPWGTGSKEAVNLIFEEKVVVLLGSHDGRNAHLAEQVSAKARITFMSAWSGDPTLSQAFVPWFFNCVPNYNQQADALVEEIYKNRRITRLAAVSDNSYDSKLALESFIKKTKISGNADPKQIFYDSTNHDFNGIIDQINKAGVEGIILFGQPSCSLKLLQQLYQRKNTLPLFGSYTLLDEDEISDLDLKYFKNIVLIYSDKSAGLKYAAFREEFKRTYNRKPGPVAAYSFDGMSLLIEAIKNCGIEREQIQKYLSEIHYEGVTGPIQFDAKGNRLDTPHMMEIKNGIPVAVDR